MTRGVNDRCNLNINRVVINSKVLSISSQETDRGQRALPSWHWLRGSYCVRAPNINTSHVEVTLVAATLCLPYHHLNGRSSFTPHGSHPVLTSTRIKTSFSRTDVCHRCRIGFVWHSIAAGLLPCAEVLCGGLYLSSERWLHMLTRRWGSRGADPRLFARARVCVRFPRGVCVRFPRTADHGPAPGYVV